MNLYIQIENGQPVNHPAFEDNLLQAFGSIPDTWEAFVRVERPTPGVYEVLENDEATYEKVNGVWTDVWMLRPMNDAEKTAKQQVSIKAAQDMWAARPQAENWSAWVLNEETFQYEPPIPRPEPDQIKLDAGIRIFWCGADNNWKEAPARPVDDNQYKFDFLAWQWVQVVN